MSEIASAYVSILPSAKGFGTTLNRQVSGEVTSTGKKAGLSFGKVFGAVAALGIGAKVGSFLKDSVTEAREAQVVGARTESVIKSMGLASSVTARQIGSMAMSLSKKTAVDDEAIQSGQNLLLTFGNVAKSAGDSNGVFAKTSSLMVDMSAAMGQDMKSSAIQLGKALNDPIKGVTALTRVGVSFTEGQKKQIEQLVESGNLMGAQKVILGELSKQFGGAAASLATPAEKASVAFGNLKEQIGTALLPVIDQVATTFTTKIVPAISGFVTGMQTGTGAGGAFADVFRTIARNISTIAPVLGTIVAGLAAYRLASLAAGIAATIQAAGTTAATGATWSLNAALRANPIGLVVTALTALGVGLVLAYKKSETFRKIVSAAFSAIRTVVGSVVGWLGQYVPQVFSAIATAVRVYVTAYKTIVVTAFNVVRAAVTAVMNAVRTVVTSVWAAVKGAFTAAAGAIGNAVGNMITAVGRFLTAVRDKFGEAVAFVRGIPGKIVAAIGNLGSVLYDAGADLIQGLINGIMSKLAAIGDAMGSVTSKIGGFLPGSPVKEGPLRSWNNGGAGKRLAALLADGIHAGTPSVARAAGGMAGAISLGGSSIAGSRVTSPVGVATYGNIGPITTRDSGPVLVEMGPKTLAAMARMDISAAREFGKEINGAAARGARAR